MLSTAETIKDDSDPHHLRVGAVEVHKNNIHRMEEHHDICATVAQRCLTVKLTKI